VLGSGEFAITTEGLSLSYLTVRSWHAGLGATYLLKQAGMEGRRGNTQNCFLCVSLGWNLKVLDEESAGPLAPGKVTFGVAMEDVWIGTHYAFLAPTFGAEIGYMTRRGPWFAHLQLGVAEIVSDGDARGERYKVELDGYWRGLGPIAVYGRLAAAYAYMDFDGFTHDFGGPIVALGLAYVSQ